ncbi:MAG: nuclear transport factor 2 family protein [Bacteroidota bacterium]
MKIRFLFLVILTCISCNPTKSQEADILAIRELLEAQAVAWSKNDLEGFMEGYHNTEDLVFFGSGGVRRGYTATLERYKESYPTQAHTGTLTFTFHDITRISADAYWVMGEYHLTREAGDAQGTFMIVLKRIDGQWKIIGDSSC